MFEVVDEWSDRVNYESFLGEAKLAWVLSTWMEETSEDEVIARFRVQPGDLYRLIETSRWLLYASHELATLFGHKDITSHLAKITERVKRGVKEELLPLVKLEGIGRVRARILYNADLKTLNDLKKVPFDKLIKLPFIGPKIAKEIKEQVGGYIKSKDWKNLKTEKDWEQQIINKY